MKKIEITQGKAVLVSDEDYDSLGSYKWSFSASTGYAVRKGRKATNEPRTVHMHRFILGVPSDLQVDHINGNKLDNRRSNLRIANCQKNSFNRKKPNIICTSIYKGVLKRKNSKKWEARIKINNKSIYLGIYENEIDAAKAYNNAANNLFGEFALLNKLESIENSVSGTSSPLI